MLKKPKSKAETFLWCLIAFYSVLLVVRAITRADDFIVFYNVARGFWSGVSPYDVKTYGNMLFKYPPWLLPLFLPFSVFPLIMARVLWGLLEVVCLLFVVRELKRFKVSDLALNIIFLMSAGLMINQARSAQLSLIFLALAFLAQKSARLWFLAVFGFSAKLLTLFPFISEVFSKRFYKRLPGVALLFVVLSTPLVFLTYSGHLSSFVSDWVFAMFKSGSLSQGVSGIVSFTSREAQGLPSFLIRVFAWSETDIKYVLWSVFLSVAFVAIFGFLVFKRWPAHLRWWGWVALTPLVQPLAWFHFYLLTIPVAALLVQKLLQYKKQYHIINFFLAYSLVTLVSEKTMGAFGHQLEMLSVKSWGVLWILSYTTFEDSH